MNKKVIKDLYSKIKKWLPVYLNKYIGRVGLIKREKNYQKFIILGRSRTGSNFLKGLLNSHTDIVCYGELFRGSDREDQNKYDAIKFLDTNVWYGYPKKFKAVGFKIFYYHSHKGQNQKLWKRILNDRSIKVLHITRKNMLNTLLSRYKAGVSDKWANTKGSSEKNIQFNIPYSEAVKDFQWTKRLEQEYRVKLKNHKVFEIVYEDLEKDANKIMNEVQKFLGMEIQKLAPSTFKQRSSSIRDSIENYDELKKRFKGSKWESFFDE
jgi:LPS sulfotransferase NodH